MRKIFAGVALLSCVSLILAVSVQAQTISLQASSLVPEVALLVSPGTGSFEDGGTFTISILVDTKGKSVNSLEVALSFDPDKLSIVGPSGGKSIIGVWVEPPIYDNATGIARYAGVIPGGIITSSGLINSITFKTKRPGQTAIVLNASSKVYLNDGFGTTARVNVGRGTFTILPKPSAGVVVFSETHPVQRNWYNNNNPILSWEREPGATEYSYVLDNQPGTIPDNTPETEGATVQSKDLQDGIWYFHIKSNKHGLWGQPGVFVIQIDTAPPAEFQPAIDYLLAALSLVNRALVSYFTTDNLSGIDHYEVGVIDKTQPTTVSPVFEEVASPYQVPLEEGGNARVLVRAFDRAGNVREAGVDIKTPFFINNFLEKYGLLVLIGLLSAIIVLMLLHYLITHHLLRHAKKALRAFEEDAAEDNNPLPPVLPPQP
ncbi:MAG: cohesin domain-containing protein [Patescibacteria group bacterium]